MSTFLQEHGEALIYGLVGILAITIICTVCTGRWKDLIPGYKTNIDKSNEEFAKNVKDKYPQIIADEIIYAEYKDKNFDYRDYVKAQDSNGYDITESIKYYGTVDVFKRGVYTLRCVVKATNELISTKKINVIVE